jgi:hypothetical protein
MIWRAGAWIALRTISTAVLRPPQTALTQQNALTMDFFQRFTLLFAALAFDAEDLEGMRVNLIITASRTSTT